MGSKAEEPSRKKGKSAAKPSTARAKPAREAKPATPAAKSAAPKKAPAAKAKSAAPKRAAATRPPSKSPPARSATPKAAAPKSAAKTAVSKETATKKPAAPAKKPSPRAPRRASADAASPPAAEERRRRTPAEAVREPEALLEAPVLADLPLEDEDEGDAPSSPIALRDEDEALAEGEPGEGEEQPAKPKRRPRAIPPMPPRRADGAITIAYSADADDAFMLYAIENEKITTEDRTYPAVRDDIQVLNDAAAEGIHDVTAISFGAYPYVQDRYQLLPCGGSYGDHRGPILVAKTPIRSGEVSGLTVAVPGLQTTAVLALRLWLRNARLNLIPVPFDKVGTVVKAGKARAGLLIHEGQLTYRDEGFVLIKDLGAWWGEETEGLPLPLGASAIRRDVPEEQRTKIALDLKRSIAYAMGHREEALDFAMRFARGVQRERVDKFVQTYVNELSLECGERGRQAVIRLYEAAKTLGLLDREVEVDFA
jgi:1,4-dihydroxy-6-naphthoate synthase